ncbi:MAG: electron transport complex subunit RsxC [Phycisphaerae bacterium]
MSNAQVLPGGTGKFARGVHPPDNKQFAADAAIEVLPSPEAVSIPLLQHTGAPCRNLVKPKQELTWGEKIGDTDAFISAPVHASIAGTAGRETVTTLPNGRHVPTVPIDAGDERPTAEEIRAEIFGGDWPTGKMDSFQPAQIADAARQAGLVGLGGAAFPTSVKLTTNPAKPIDTILVNGCECEPFLTADYRLMLEYPAPIVTGALLAARATGARQILIAVEDNKPAAIDALCKAAAGTDIQVASLHTQYPMGGEKQTIKASLGREVPTGGLPLDVGVVVINVGTAAALARAVLRGKPLTHRVITVSGGGVNTPRNILAPIGVTYGQLIDFAGGLNDSAARVVAGGPMMGFALGDLDAVVTKGTSGVTVLTAEDIARTEETRCVRCGRCVDVCPLNLVPTKIALAARQKQWDLARTYHMQACMECGCCAYTCPAGIPLVQLMRMGKAQMPRE